jgi:alcohol dehydrogenase class IV
MQGEYIALPQEHIIFGAGTLVKLVDEVKRLNGSRVLIITGHSVATKTDILKQVQTILGDLHVGTFDGISQHTLRSTVEKAVQMVRDTQADLLVSIGGGSPIDAGKVVAYYLKDEKGKILPHIAIPTTLSAAEFSHLAGITEDETRTKGGLQIAEITPTAVILSAEITLPTPLWLWLSTGIRALDHAVETLYAPGAHPANDVLALEAIRLLFLYLPQCRENPDDLEIRTQLQIAAWLSFFSSINTPMGLSHNIGRRIGATYNVAHGITSCISLPHVMRAMTKNHATALARIAKVLELPESQATAETAALASAQAVHNLVAKLELPQKLSEVNVTETDINQIIEAAVGQGAIREEVEPVLKAML